MSNISLIYITFLLVLFIILLISNKLIKDETKLVKIEKYLILIFSYIYILYADYKFLLIIISLSLCLYIFQNKYQNIGIIISIMLLCVCKYLNFFISTFTTLLNIDSNILNIVLPLGISFYTFSAISFLVDRKRQKIESQSFIDIATYLAFFPKLTSGPIQKMSDFSKQINKKRNLNVENIKIGIQIYALGVFKKIVLADRLSVFVNQVFETPKAFSSLTLFLAAIAYSLEIYFDFSGYSDIAIGVAKIFDFDLPKNFNLPYLSCNVTEFWKRWHISLSSWLQEYLYISLGGNRKGKIRQYINLLLTMTIGGLWHGANLTFVVWGALNGLALIIHKLFISIVKPKKSNILINIFKQILTFLFITLTWIYFKADSISKANTYILRMFSLNDGVEQIQFWFIVSFIIFLISCVYFFIKNPKEKYSENKCLINYEYPLLNLDTIFGLTLFLVFCGLILCLAYCGSSPFIYGNF